jgi:hypothetical protein
VQASALPRGGSSTGRAVGRATDHLLRCWFKSSSPLSPGRPKVHHCRGVLIVPSYWCVCPDLGLWADRRSTPRRGALMRCSEWPKRAPVQQPRRPRGRLRTSPGNGPGKRAAQVGAWWRDVAIRPTWVRIPPSSRRGWSYVPRSGQQRWPEYQLPAHRGRRAGQETTLEAACDAAEGPPAGAVNGIRHGIGCRHGRLIGRTPHLTARKCTFESCAWHKASARHAGARSAATLG